YRKFNIKTVEGPDDFASMEEVVHRRYRRLLDEGEPLPQLIVIDGGKGQLSAAMEVMSQLGVDDIQLVAISKGPDRNAGREQFHMQDKDSFTLPPDSAAMHFLQRLRDEAHRFSLSHHRNRRSKGTFKSELEGVKGIGPETIKELLRQFKSVKRIKAASFEQLKEIVGHAKAKALTDYFSSDK
ncbi:MAG: excinuclease ABC subunit C, partial [Flavobacteriia bacterium]|nr:excinuclease ABC subunit C [Flavobacteriia bacterium]